MLQFSRKALAVHIPFPENLCFVYIVVCSVTVKSGVIAKLTWTTCVLHVFGSQERELYPSIFPLIHLPTLKTSADCVLLVPACILHAGAAPMGRVAHLTHYTSSQFVLQVKFCLFFSLLQ